MTPLIFRNFLILAAWTFIVFVAYATISPIQARPIISRSADLEHIAAFAILGGLFCLGYPQRIVLVCWIVFGSAIIFELMQILTPDRHPALLDVIEKIAGGVAGIAMARVILAMTPLRRWFQI
jgi:VanZ family protein